MLNAIISERVLNLVSLFLPKLVYQDYIIFYTSESVP